MMNEESRRFSRSTDDTGGSGLTLAPMIDVVFLLLIFFMVSTTFVARPGLKLDLPQSDSTTETPAERWVISIERNGQLYLNDDETDLDSLQSRVNAELKPVVIHADEAVSHGIVVTVLDTVKSAGVESVDLSTEAPEDEPENATP